MNWGQIQIESLRKMFLNSDVLSIDNLNDYKTDKKYKTYLDAMPQACNEAINYIIENGRPNIKSQELIKHDSQKYKLNEILTNFKRFYELSYDGNDFINYSIEGKDTLVIKNWQTGNITIYYEAFLDYIDSSTLDSYDIDLDKDLLSLIPLYVAGELYKDDDIAMATQYLNEFMTQVSNLGGKDYSGPNSIQTVYNIY